MKQPDNETWDSCTWEGSRRSQIRYALGMNIQQKMEAAEGMADVCRHFQWMRENGKFKQADKNKNESS